jgi:hypothetical protein
VVVVVPMIFPSSINGTVKLSEGPANPELAIATEPVHASPIVSNIQGIVFLMVMLLFLSCKG